MKLSYSYIRTSIFGIIFGILLGTVLFTQVFSYPEVGFNNVAKEGSLFSNYFSKMLVSTDISTDGTIKDADNLGSVDSALYQKRVVGLCPANAPAVRINPDGTTTCRTIYRWEPETNWGACIPTSGGCGGGTQYKNQICKDYKGTTVSDALCPTPKPMRLSQACRATDCSCNWSLPNCAYADGCTTTSGSPTSLNQAWQQNAGSCSYTCNPGYGGANCDPKPTITQSRTPNPGKVGDDFVNTWSTTNATSVYATCWGEITFNGYLPTSGDIPQSYGGDEWIGTTTCEWVAYGPGGQSDVHREVITVTPRE